MLIILDECNRAIHSQSGEYRVTALSLPPRGPDASAVRNLPMLAACTFLLLLEHLVCRLKSFTSRPRRARHVVSFLPVLFFLLSRNNPSSFHILKVVLCMRAFLISFSFLFCFIIFYVNVTLVLLFSYIVLQSILYPFLFNLQFKCILDNRRRP